MNKICVYMWNKYPITHVCNLEFKKIKLKLRIFSTTPFSCIWKSFEGSRIITS